MLETVVKFVDDGKYFVSSEGPVVRLFTVGAVPAMGSITVKAKADFDTGDYLVIPTPTMVYYAWFDKNGDGVTDHPEPAGFDTDAEIQVDVSSATTAAQVATALASALNAVSNLEAEVNATVNTQVDVLVTEYGVCDVISDFSCGFTLSGLVPGVLANGVIKTGIPNNDTAIEEMADISYSSSTDTLTVLAKVKHKVYKSLKHPDLGYTTTYSWKTVSHSNWVLG